MKKFLLFLIFTIVIVSGLFFFRNHIFDFFNVSPQARENIGAELSEIEKKILTPPPLFGPQAGNVSILSKSGVISATNAERVKYGFSPLKENEELDASAQAKAMDMLKNQYFAHKSPSGLGVSDLAKAAGYDYIVIGENLALGNFENDNSLVKAWMDSPGHRANILNKDYRDIGVGVIYGSYEGKNVWLAVQHFGKPLSLCDIPSQTFKTEIEIKQAQLQDLRNSLDALSIEIKNSGPKWGNDYRQKVEDYNSLVSRYNAMVEDVKGLISGYNAQIQKFNECAGLN